MTPTVTEALTYVHRCGACRGKVRTDWKFCPWCGEKAEWDSSGGSSAMGLTATEPVRYDPLSPQKGLLFDSR
jgi:hypothetical protein